MRHFIPSNRRFILIRRFIREEFTLYIKALSQISVCHFQSYILGGRERSNNKEFNVGKIRQIKK